MRILGGEGWVWGVSDAEGEHLGRIGGIVVEALAALPAIHSCQNHALEERRRRVALLAVLGEHDLGDLVGRIQSDEVEQRQWTHGIAAAELHRLVDIRYAPHAALDCTDGIEQVRDEQQIDDEARVVNLRSEEHTSELQSLRHLVCRLLLEKKKRKKSCYFSQTIHGSLRAQT